MNWFLFYVFAFSLSAFMCSLFKGLIADNVRYKLFKEIIWIILMTIIPLLIACNRYGIGQDYNTYENMIDLAGQSSRLGFYIYFNDFEIGDWAFFKIFYGITNSPVGVFAVYSILTWIIMAIAILYYRDRVHIFTAIILIYILFYPESLNVIRQGLAIAIVLVALRYIENKKLLKFLILIIIATLFHYTSIIMIPYYFFYNYRNKYGQLISKLIVIIYTILPFVFVALFINGTSIPIIGDYFKNYKLAFNTDFIVDLLWRIVLYLPWIKYVKSDIQRDKRNKLYYMMLLSDFEYIILSFMINWGIRLTYYTVFAQVLIISNRIKYSSSIKTKHARIFYYLTFYIILFALLYCYWQRSGIVPFKSLAVKGREGW